MNDKKDTPNENYDELLRAALRRPGSTCLRCEGPNCRRVFVGSSLWGAEGLAFSNWRELLGVDKFYLCKDCKIIFEANRRTLFSHAPPLAMVGPIVIGRGVLVYLVALAVAVLAYLILRS